MDLGKALTDGLLDQKAGPKPIEDTKDEDMATLYTEFKNAKDTESGLRALRQLVKMMK